MGFPSCFAAEDDVLHIGQGEFTPAKRLCAGLNSIPELVQLECILQGLFGLALRFDVIQKVGQKISDIVEPTDQHRSAPTGR